MTAKNRVMLCVATASLALVAGARAMAQDAPPAPTPPADTAQPTAPATGEIVVTATRREQALQSVPIAVTALGGPALANNRINSTADLAQQVPNLNITSQVGAMVVYLRGIGQLSTNPGQEPSVATYVDGVYQPTVFGALMSLANIQRVEVIKGPQGTLFGRNATGGLINIVTRDPTQKPELDLDLAYGNYHTARAAAYVAGGITENVAADLSVYYNDQDHGVGENLTTGHPLGPTRNVDLRSKVVITPTDSTKIHLSASYDQNRTSVGNNVAIIPGSTGFGYGAKGGFYDVTANVDPYDRNTTYAFSGRIDQDLGPFDLVSITAYNHNTDYELEDADATPAPIINAVFSQRSKVFTQEVQLVSKKGSPLSWIVGAYYYRSNATGAPTGIGFYGSAFGDGGEQSRPRLRTDSISGYGEATYQVLPKLNITAGVRYTSDRKRLDGYTDTIDPDGTVTTVPGPVARKTFNKLTYRAIVDYHLTDAIMAYASYSRGFKSGGYDTAFPTGIAYKPEVVDAYEGGFKTQFFDRHLTLNIAGFHYDYKDLQLPILVPPASQITVNAANARIDGVDLDGSLRVGRQLTANFGFGYLHSEYRNFTQAPCTSVLPDGSTTGFVCDVSGRSLLHSPKTTFNLGATYTQPTGAGDVALTGSFSRQAKFFYDVTNRLDQPAYAMVNAQLSWQPKATPFTLIAFVENLTNKKYTVAEYAQAGFPDRYVAGRPRMYGLEAKAKF